MAIQTSFGYTDSSASTPLSVSVPKLNWVKDFSVDSARPRKAGEIFLSNVTSPLDQPEIIRRALETVKNIYNGTGIDPSVYAISKLGFSYLTQVDDILRVTDSSVPQFRQDLPIHAHLVLRAAQSAYITTADLLAVVLRLVGTIFDGAANEAELNALIRGQLTPSGMRAA